MEHYDVAIIGKGPAGISAALYTVRANLKTILVGTDASSLLKAEKIENYFGFEQPVSGKQLLEAGLRQAERLGASIANEEVTALEFAEGFAVKTVTGEYSARAVLLATGLAPRRPELPGVREWEGKGVSYCTTCDGFFYRNKKTGVLGNGNYAVQEAMELEPFTKDITIFTNGNQPEFSGEYAQKAGRFRIRTEPVREIRGENVLREIVLETGAQQIDGLFIASGSASSADFAVKLGILMKDNAIITDENQKTNLDGVYAAGDCTGGLKQVSTAVGQGAVAGQSIIRFLRRH